MSMYYLLNAKMPFRSNIPTCSSPILFVSPISFVQYILTNNPNNSVGKAVSYESEWVAGGSGWQGRGGGGC